MIKCRMKYEHNNISPLDSRYANKIPDIRNAFSEHTLIKTRFIIEINWILYLCNKYNKYINKLLIFIITYKASFVRYYAYLYFFINN